MQYMCHKDLCYCLQPFVDDVHPLQSMFLPRVYALLIPILAGVVAMIGLGTAFQAFIFAYQACRFRSKVLE